MLRAENLVIFLPHFAYMLFAVLSHLAVLSGRSGLIESEHRSNHTTRFGCTLKQMCFQHFLAIVLPSTVLTVERSTVVNQVKIDSIVVKMNKISGQNDRPSVKHRSIAHR